jgi:transcriptional regulator with XRE-family HTH domain
MAVAVKSSLGFRIAQAREKKQLKQEVLGNLVGLSRQHISKIERNLVSPRIADLLRIADTCDTTIFELLGARIPKSYSSAKDARTHERLQDLLQLGDADVTARLLAHLEEVELWATANAGKKSKAG